MWPAFVFMFVKFSFPSCVYCTVHPKYPATLSTRSMLLVFIRNYLKSALRYKFLILDANHPYRLYLREQGRENPWLFF